MLSMHIIVIVPLTVNQTFIYIYKIGDLCNNKVLFELVN